MTDASAQVLWWRDQTPFGQTVAEGGFSQNPLRFPGQFTDAESGLAYNYFRDYDPALGRYIQSDPIGLGGGLNTYAYVMGNPLRYTDPTGQFIPFVPIVVGIAERYGAEIIIGAAISAGIEYYCTGTVTAQGVLIGAILGPVGWVVGGRAWVLASRYIPGVRWVGAAVGRGAGAIDGAVAKGAGAVGGAAAAALERLGGRAVGQAIQRIENSVIGKPRVGNANKIPDGQHGFPDIVDNYAGEVVGFNIPTKGPGGQFVRTSELRQLEGSYNGVDGVFEWIIDQGAVTHRRFIPGGKVTGFPNQIPGR